MDIRKVKKLIELLEESGISELEISEGEESVRISRHPRMAMQAPVAMGSAMLQAAPQSVPALPATAAGEHKPRNDDYTVTSPMVGTYYSAASPGAKSFVDIGTDV
jgi:acetyl-CoA carboxylase biotin carboxyl carrier protein